MAAVADPGLDALPRRERHVVNHHSGRLFLARSQLNLPRTRHARRNRELVRRERIHYPLVARREPRSAAHGRIRQPHLDRLVRRHHAHQATVNRVSREVRDLPPVREIVPRRIVDVVIIFIGSVQVCPLDSSERSSIEHGIRGIGRRRNVSVNLHGAESRTAIR